MQYKKQTPNNHFLKVFFEDWGFKPPKNNIFLENCGFKKTKLINIEELDFAYQILIFLHAMQFFNSKILQS